MLGSLGAAPNGCFQQQQQCRNLFAHTRTWTGTPTRFIHFAVTAAEGAAAAAPAAPPVEEGGEEGAAEGGEPEGDDPVSLAKAEVKEAEGALKAAEEARTKAGEALDVARKVLGAINGAVASVADVAVAKLRGTRVVPQATFHVLKAVLHVLGKPPATFSNWKRAFAYFTPDLFTDIQDYDATKVGGLMQGWRAPPPLCMCCGCWVGCPERGGAAFGCGMPELWRLWRHCIDCLLLLCGASAEALLHPRLGPTGA